MLSYRPVYAALSTFVQLMDNFDNVVLKVPAGSEDLYRNIDVFSEFKHIEGIDPEDYQAYGGIDGVTANVVESVSMNKK